MDKFSELTTNSIVSIIKHRLKVFEEQGIHVEVVEPKYSDICIEMKLVLTLTNASEEAQEERRKFFIENCESIGLSPDTYGKTFKAPNSNRTWTVVGLDFHEENPVLIQQNLDEPFYRISVLDLKRFLG